MRKRGYGFVAGADRTGARARIIAQFEGHALPCSARLPSIQSEVNIDAASIRSEVFAMEWPPRSGVQREFPEVDAGGWFTIARAIEKMLPGQRPFLEQLRDKVAKAKR